jgi:hypothetical protein
LQLDLVELERRRTSPVLAQKLADLGQFLRQSVFASIAHFRALYE